MGNSEPDASIADIICYVNMRLFKLPYDYSFMLLASDLRASRYEASVRQRLEILEQRLRVASDGGIKLADYGEWLEQSGQTVPSRRTLRLDMERYVSECDDLLYGEGLKSLRIDVHAFHDAVRYFLGEPWLSSPLRPRLASSVCRCLLLAMRQRREVEFPYAALAQMDTPPGFRIHRGVPLRLLPGADSGYMAIWLESGRVMPINLARVVGRVFFTGRGTETYIPPPSDPVRVLRVETGDAQSLRRCLDQFAGAERVDGGLCITLPASLATMTADLLEAWWRRTMPMERQAARLIEVGDTRVSIELASQLYE